MSLTRVFKGAWHDPQPHPPFFSNPLWFWYQQFCHIFLTFVLNFGADVPNTLGEINRNVAWKLETVVTTLNKTINNVSTIFSLYFQTRYMFAFSLWMKYLDENWLYLQVIATLIFRNFHARHALLKEMHTFSSILFLKRRCTSAFILSA